MRTISRALAAALLAWPAAADELPERRLSFAFGGDASLSMSERDRAYFNDLDYGHNALRLARVSLTGRVQAGRWAAVLAELRSENESARVQALYLSLHPFRERAFDLQIGRIPPVFGAYPRRGYAPAEPLPGVPLPYQYLTTLRADALPATADDLLRRRGQGWFLSHPVGNPDWASGLPMVSAFQWDTGVQVRCGSEGGRIEASAALTQGSLSHPLFEDDNDGKQVAGRVAFRPMAGLVAGVSAARGQYLDRAAVEAAARISGRRETPRQVAVGLDVEYVWEYALVRAEAIWSRWHVPAVSEPLITDPLAALGAFVEGRYRLLPGLTLGARVEHQRFSQLRGSAVELPWDAPVWRAESALAYALHRQVIAKAGYQHNWRDASTRRSKGLVVGQLVVWF